MVQQITWEYVLDGFRFELETHLKPATVDYYCVHARLFARWAQEIRHVTDPRLISKRDVQDFFHHITHSPATTLVGNRPAKQVSSAERTRWPYYRSLRRFFSWAFQEGFIAHNYLDDIAFKPPKPVPIEPYRLEHIESLLEVLDHDWRVAPTPRQKMLAARDKAIFLMFLESGLRLGELGRGT
jgi:integrase